MQDRALAGIEALLADEGATFMAAALVVNDCICDGFDRVETLRALERLSDRYDDRLTPWSFLRDEGFGGHSPVDVVQGSRIDALLETRSGLPITLAALVSHVAVSSGQKAEGINFPGHFLVRVGQALVDPFQMVTRSEADFLASLPEDVRQGNPFVPARPSDILLRMFNNLKYHFAARAEFHRALEMLDCQQRVLPDSSTLFFEQGEYWLRLGSVDGARTSFAQAVALGRDQQEDAAAAMAERRLTELGDRQDTLH
jgi:regulator of sirC expression with transglutaminase-like and TPR domain